ncbi:uracil-DNA glycosylase family protein [Acinetobacter larvae]|uniref:DNA glycosylase n=1 Tax=Acinetobacter larvae TaxID=1789224 RepID=A0A1B2LZR4_9GAMM|nr:uracil-DNA glycosylase family protein [Acinetobacter larvae]AOA58417.1 DNA glycosylase [Acinetobacter larvae]
MCDIETHPLAPYLPASAKLLMLGSFPPPQIRWKMDFYYPNFQNDMWRILGAIFYDDRDYFIDTTAKQFKLAEIKQFLDHTGIAIYDSAYQVRRLKGNAADKFLEVVQATDLEKLLLKIPDCHHLMTTGDKATETLMQSFPTDTIKPVIGRSSQARLAGRELTLHRMPSSSRAYPLALADKIIAYKNFFKEINLL